MRPVLLAGFALVMGGCSGPGRPGAEPRPAIDLQGHRGARGLAPENSLLGFQKALAIGVTTLELDVGMTADGVLVVCHDPELGPSMARKDGRYIEAPVAIRQLTFEQLRAYDVGRLAPGSSDARRFPEQVGADGVAIPTLEQVLNLGERLSAGTIRYNIETKLDPSRRHLTASPGEMTAALVDAISRRGLGERVTIQSFDWSSLVIAKRLAPGIARVCLTTEKKDDTVEQGRPGASPWLGGIDVDDYPHLPAAVRAIGCAVWSPNFRDLDPATVQKAQDEQLRVVPWTVNDGADIRAVLSLGVDGVISDYPNRVRAELAARGWPLPTSHNP